MKLLQLQALAKAKGETTFAPDSLCRNGHNSLKYTSNKACLECLKEKQNEPDRKAYRKQHDAKNRHKHREYMRGYVKRIPDFNKKKTLRVYGLTLDEFNDLLKLQNNSCAICKLIFNDNVRVCVDHCHTSNEVRGLLCRNCNAALGLFKDSLTSLNAAIEYLK